MSLHQSLIAEGMKLSSRDLTKLAPEDQAAWNEAVAAYQTAAGNAEDFTFERPFVITTDSLTQIADDAEHPDLDAPLADALKRAAPVYRKYWWDADEKANRFFIGYATAMLRDAGEELVRAHEKVYRTEWPKRVQVYITPYGGPYGAYTLVVKSGAVITTMSSRDAGYQGLRALEMMLHESSHAIVGPYNGIVARAIADAAKKRNVNIPLGLWHAILFATSSELTRRSLLDRGVTDFVPSSADLLTRVWPQYREPIEKYWLPYLSGQGTLEEAIDQVVGAIKR